MKGTKVLSIVHNFSALVVILPLSFSLRYFVKFVEDSLKDNSLVSTVLNTFAFCFSTKIFY